MTNDERTDDIDLDTPEVENVADLLMGGEGDVAEIDDDEEGKGRHSSDLDVRGVESSRKDDDASDDTDDTSTTDDPSSRKQPAAAGPISTPDELNRYHGWIQNEIAALTQMANNGQLTPEQHYQADQYIKSHQTRLEHAAAQTRTAGVELSERRQQAIAAVAAFDPGFGDQSKRDIKLTEFRNHLNELGVSERGMATISDPTVFAALYKSMHDQKRVVEQQNRQLRGLEKAKQERQEKQKMAARKRAAKEVESSRMVGLDAQANAIGDLLAKVGAV